MIMYIRQQFPQNLSLKDKAVFFFKCERNASDGSVSGTDKQYAP